MKTVTFEKDGPDTIVRKVEAFEGGYGDSDRSETAVTRELKKAGFL